MLKFSFQDIKFNNHFILASHNMEIYPGELTILCGESGSGKTTLLQELTLHQVFTKSYIYQDIDILSLSDDEKRDFIFQVHFHRSNTLFPFILINHSLIPAQFYHTFNNLTTFRPI